MPISWLGDEIWTPAPKEGPLTPPSCAKGAISMAGVNFKEDVLLRGVCSLLEQLVRKSEQGKPVKDVKSLNLFSFGQAILRGGLCSKECFVIAYVYGQRLLQKQAASTINTRNVHRFVSCLSYGGFEVFGRLLLSECLFCFYWWDEQPGD